MIHTSEDCKFKELLSPTNKMNMASPEPFSKERLVRKNMESFPVKLMHILQLIDTIEPELAHIISWQPTGTTFRIHDKKQFEKLVKQRGFFNQKSYSSFRRQLNLWGFKKIGKRCAADCGVYGHPMFLRGNPRICAAISRKNCDPFKNKQSSVLIDDEVISMDGEVRRTFSYFSEEASVSGDLRAVTDSTKSIDTNRYQRQDQDKNYVYYNNIRRNKPMMFEPMFEPFQIEPLQLDEGFTPLPSKYGVLLREAIETSEI